MKSKQLLNDCANSYIEYYKNDENTVIEKSIFNNTATIVIWSDGTKIVAKCRDNDVAKKFLGTNKSHSNYVNEFNKWLLKSGLKEKKND